MFSTTTSAIDPDFERFFQTGSHQPSSHASRSLTRFYHAILVQSRALPDPSSSKIIEQLVRARFGRKQNSPEEDGSGNSSTQAKRCLTLLQRANLGDIRALQKVAEIAYGQRGRLRHMYLAAVTSQLSEPPPELIPGTRRSRPPTLPEKLAALWTLQFGRNKLDPRLPWGPEGEHGKPLDRRREANLRWSHHTTLLKKTKPPIPVEHYQALAAVASGSAILNLVSVPQWRQRTRQEMIYTANMKTTEVHSLCKRRRLMQRLYARILSKSPVLYQVDSGRWKARYARSAATLKEFQVCQ